MAISQYSAASWESYRRKRNCLPEIAPQGHFLALRAQGATAPLGPRNDKSESFTPQNAYRKSCQSAWRSASAMRTRELPSALADRTRPVGERHAAPGAALPIRTG